MIKSPSKANYNEERKTTTLEFSDKELDIDGEYYMRGGICWPEIVNPREGIEGYALMGGYDVFKKITIIFEVTPFVCIDHITGEGGRIETNGLSSWFNRNWTKYFSRAYFYHSHADTHRKYNMQIRRSKMIDPNPRFIDAPYQDQNQAIQIIWEKLSLNALYYNDGTLLDKSIEAYKIAPDSKPKTALKALMAYVVGSDRYPYRKKSY